jgi:hypothetical protein
VRRRLPNLLRFVRVGRGSPGGAVSSSNVSQHAKRAVALKVPRLGCAFRFLDETSEQRGVSRFCFVFHRNADHSRYGGEICWKGAAFHLLSRIQIEIMAKTPLDGVNTFKDLDDPVNNPLFHVEQRIPFSGLRRDSQSTQEFVHLVEARIVENDFASALLRSSNLHAHPDRSLDRLFQILKVGRAGCCFA